MKKTSVSDHLTSSEKKGAIEAALKGGLEPEEVFKAILQNVYGSNERKRLVIQWGEKMGLEPSDSLQRAQAANLIPTKRAPRGRAAETPRHKTSGRTGA
ncbi:MAG: hypothetical protein WA734_12055 [Candidatus Acidiferrales bacterium]